MLREQDRFLPIANVARLMKKSIPKTGKVKSLASPIIHTSSIEFHLICTSYIRFQIAKDARECVQECVSEFVSFITSEASERCHQEKRKTINGEDILVAMQSLGFDNYMEPLKAYLQKYRESMKGEKSLVISSDGDLFILGDEKGDGDNGVDPQSSSPPPLQLQGQSPNKDTPLTLFYNSDSHFSME